MDEDQLVGDYPRLYHLASGDAVASVERHGLLSTAALADLFEVPLDERDAILRQHRSKGRRLLHPKHGLAFVRDQRPINEAALASLLDDGLKPSDWFELLNGKVFFWLHVDRVLRMIKTYSGSRMTLFEFDTQTVIDRYRNGIRLSPINSGATNGAKRRGRSTFLPIAQYDIAARAHRGLVDRVVELTIDFAVPGAGELIVDRRVF